MSRSTLSELPATRRGGAGGTEAPRVRGGGGVELGRSAEGGGARRLGGGAGGGSEIGALRVDGGGGATDFGFDAFDPVRDSSRFGRGGTDARRVDEVSLAGAPSLTEVVALSSVPLVPGEAAGGGVLGDAAFPLAELGAEPVPD